MKCSQGFIFLDTGKCGQVSANCKTFNSFTGVCTGCYLGYALEFGNCINSTNNLAAIDPNCAAFQNNICVTCSKNFYFNSNGACVAVDPLCKGFNPANGACTACYESFVLQGSICVEDTNFQSTDPNCAEWLQGVCLRCATRTFVNSQGLCQTVNINCNTYSSINGVCTSCYPGFENQNGQCIEAVSPSSCRTFNSDGTCAVCATGSYLLQGSCILIDPQCASFNTTSLICTACY